MDVWPEPPQVGHGSSMTVPLPPQRGHGSLNANAPTSRPRTPRPLHSGHRRGLVPGLAPEPPQSWHATGVSTDTGTWAPRIACSKLRLTSTSTSAPRRAVGSSAVRVPPPPPRLRKIDEKMSAKSPNPPMSPPVNPPPPPLGARPPKRRRASYSRRLSGSDSTSWAWEISLKRSSALASPGLRSGWLSRASFRYAFLISSALAVFSTPRVV